MGDCPATRPHPVTPAVDRRAPETPPPRGSHTIVHTVPCASLPCTAAEPLETPSPRGSTTVVHTVPCASSPCTAAETFSRRSLVWDISYTVTTVPATYTPTSCAPGSTIETTTSNDGSACYRDAEDTYCTYTEHLFIGCATTYTACNVMSCMDMGGGRTNRFVKKHAATTTPDFLILPIAMPTATSIFHCRPGTCGPVCRPESWCRKGVKFGSESATTTPDFAIPSNEMQTAIATRCPPGTCGVDCLPSRHCRKDVKFGSEPTAITPDITLSIFPDWSIATPPATSTTPDIKVSIIHGSPTATRCPRRTCSEGCRPSRHCRKDVRFGGEAVPTSEDLGGRPQRRVARQARPTARE